MKNLFLHLLMCICFSASIFAQPDPQVSFNATNPANSDYRIQLYFDYNNNYCDCGTQNTVIRIHTDVTILGPVIETYANLIFSGGYLVVGPGFSEDLAASFTMSGRRTWIGDSGGVFCVNTICGGIIDNACPCGDIFGTGTVFVSTANLKPPSNLNVSSGTFPDKVTLSWQKATDFPNNLHFYKVYRDGDEIGTVNGSGPYSFTDSTVDPGTTYTYEVRTNTSSFGGVESSSASAEGSAFSVEASDGIYANRVRLTWGGLPGNTEDIRIMRSLPGTSDYEEVAILNSSASTYNDTEGIPGFNYTYLVEPLSGGNLIPGLPVYSDSGYSKPNGKISGYVRSTLGTGVPNVQIDVELLSSIPPGGASLPSCPATYCTTTDNSGYYEITEVYYYEEADFRITPSLAEHEYTPDEATRTLSLNARTAAGVDFTDETVFTVGGTVTYPVSPNNAICGVEGADIVVNGEKTGIKTNVLGEWSLTILEEATYTFSVDYFGHLIEYAPGVTEADILVNGNIDMIDFVDQEKGDIVVTVQGGCQTPLGSDVVIELSAPPNCFLETYFTGPDGEIVISDLPARDYTVKVIDILGSANPTEILGQLNRPIELDLTTKDSIEMVMERDTMIITPMQMDTFPNDSIIVTPADTQFLTVNDTILKPVRNSAEFIYRSPLVISTDFAEAGAVVTSCTSLPDGDPIIVMEQGADYVLTFEITELLNNNCFIDSGYLKIYDFVSDRGDDFVRIPIKNGIATYVINAGEPEIAENPDFHNHEKLLYVVPEVGFLDPEPISYWLLVTGARQLTPSFITRSPEVPMLVIHDPPGDNSYAFVEKGQTFRTFSTTSYQVEGEGGAFGKVGGGLAADIFSVEIKLGGFFEFAVSAGRNESNEFGYETQITVNETFSTSSADNFTGDEGDVYVGASFNQEYSLGQTLDFDPMNCSFSTDTIPTLDILGFATTFSYTEKHIKQTLLPTIALLMKEFQEGNPNSTTTEDSIAYNRLRADSVSWGRVLAANDLARGDHAVFQENLSFSAGAAVNRSYESSESSTVSYESEVFVGGEFKAGVDFEFKGFGAYVETQLGAMGRFRTSTTIAGGTEGGNSRTVGYVLDDGDIGDFFSVDVKEDTSYNVPAFELVLGTSSCPQEEGTQARDRPVITIANPDLDNVPPDEQATFVAMLKNESESGETREYHVRTVSVTNPDGALIRLGGQLINNSPASFFLQPQQVLNIALDVQKGPQASNYERIGIMIYPPCEYELWQDNGVLKNADTAYITVNFESACTNVSLVNPNDQWIVNQNNNDVLLATFSGYDVDNPSFEGLTLQLKKNGQGYQDVASFDKEELILSTKDVFLDVSNFEDGFYTLRARANCVPGIGYTYSSELSGIIDRTSIAPFGTPTPGDGFLQAGQEVSVTFDKLINCDLGGYPTGITLIRTDDSTAIPLTPQCSGDKIILISANELISMTDLDGVELAASVNLIQDQFGNIQKYPVNWTFLVNVKPVFWDPDFVYVAAQEGEEATLVATLKNNAQRSKVFSLDGNDDPGIQLPGWLAPRQTRGTVLANNDYEVVFDINPELLPGIYTGVVTALVDGQLVSMDVQFENLAKPVSWNFNPADYAYSMNIVAQFSLTAADAPLSNDQRDLIGAFVNGEIRGINNIEYVPEKDVYAAYLTVYSNQPGGANAPEIQFRFWKALSGIEYAALESVQFQSDGQLGTPDAPFILHPEGIFQVIPLNVGWNWISFNLESADMSREKVFQSIISSESTNEITVNAFNETTSYVPGAGWQGNLKDLEIGPGYLVHLSDHRDTLRVIGSIPTAPIEVPVQSGWNWIGFPKQSAQPISPELDGLSLTTGDLVKSQEAFAMYDASINTWLGNLKEFAPGEGYKLHVNDGNTIIFDVHEGPEFIEYNVSEFEYVMNIACTFNPEELGEPDHESLLVAAFIDGVCRGTAEVEYIDALNMYQSLLLIHGNISDQEKEVTFSVVNRESSMEYYGTGEYVAFSVNQIYRNVLNPYPLYNMTTSIITSEMHEFELFQNEPNPVQENTTFGFYLPDSGEIHLGLYDLKGQLIDVIAEGNYGQGIHRLNYSLETLPAGIYYYRLEAGSFAGVKKLMKN